jgi:hypothetical protein
MLREVTDIERNSADMKSRAPELSICKEIKEIYQIAKFINTSKSDLIMYKCRTALILAQRMSAKLIQYKQQPTKE